MSTELFATIAAIIRRHLRDNDTIPVLKRFDPHEQLWGEPLPHLFQRKVGSRRAVMSTMAIAHLISDRCEDLATVHPRFAGITFTPHDFRRLFATEVVNNGLPIHIGAALLGHLNIETTRGYVAAFNEDLVRHYQAFLDRRRAQRPTDEYRPATDEEWTEFEHHFDQRKVELGNCGRPYGTPATTNTPASAAPCSTSTRRCLPAWTSSRPTSRPAWTEPRPKAGWARPKASISPCRSSATNAPEPND